MKNIYLLLLICSLTSFLGQSQMIVGDRFTSFGTSYDDDAKAYADQFGYYRSTVTVNRDLIIKCKD